MPARIETAFVTRIYRAQLAPPARVRRLNAELAHAIGVLSGDDSAGRTWSGDHGYGGYTSYASLNDLAWRMPEFETLAALLAPHTAAFARAAGFDMTGRRLALDSLWVNRLDPGGHHGAHIHPLSAISGTYYVAVPKGAPALVFEDPRLAQMMAAPPRRGSAAAALQTRRAFTPAAGEVFLWESFLRHEVPVNRSTRPRLSVSFNVRVE